LQTRAATLESLSLFSRLKVRTCSPNYCVILSLLPGGPVMNERVDTAVLNNIVWCGIVCETHGIAGISKKHVWATTSKSPTFYPDVITSSRHVAVGDVADIMGEREVFSIKDSFANLDMSPFGFGMLFEAEWIHHAPLTNSDSVPPAWRLATTESEFAEWTFSRGSENVIRPDVLKRRDVKVFTYEHMGKRGGFIANLGADAVGISNVFSEGNSEHLWPDIHKVVSAEFPGLPMVGYERGADLAAALRSGWTAAGPLRVWVKSNASGSLRRP